MSAPRPEHIPAELRGLKRWVLWRLEDVGRPKKAKVPYTVDGRRARTTDERDWSTFDEACAASVAHDGVGFVFTGTPYAGVDLDGAIGDGGMTATAQEFVDALPGAYAERSQSGHGVHLIVRGQLPPGGRRKDDVEMYDTTSPRYFAITGDVLGAPVDAVPDHTAALQALHARWIGGSGAQAAADTPKEVTDPLVKQIVESARFGREARHFFSLFDAGEFREGKRSEADYDLAKILWRQPGATEDAVVDAMVASRLYREDKWSETRAGITLLRHTVRAARPGGGAGLEAESVVSQTIEEMETDPEVLNPPKTVAHRLAWEDLTTLFAGREKWSGKSTFLTAAAVSVCLGDPFLDALVLEGATIEPGHVLWVSADLEPKRDIVRRVRRFAGRRQLHGRFHVFYPRSIDWDARLNELEAELDRLRGVVWIVVDTMAHFALVEEAGQASGWVQTLIPLRKVTQRFKCAVTLVHHSAKSAPDEYRDSTAIGGAVDQVIIYQNNTEKRTGTRRHVMSIGRVVDVEREWEVELETGDRWRFKTVAGPGSPESRVLPFVVAAAFRGRPDGLLKSELKNRIHDACQRLGNGVKSNSTDTGKYVQYAIDERKLLEVGEGSGRWIDAPGAMPAPEAPAAPRDANAMMDANETHEPPTPEGTP